MRGESANRRQLLRAAAGVLGCGSLAAFIVNPGALGGYFGLPLAVLALLALWSSRQSDAERRSSERVSPDDVAPMRSRPSERAASALIAVGVVAALLVLCAYALYAATFLL